MKPVRMSMVVVVMGLFFACAGLGASVAAADEVVARVNDTEITLSEFYEVLEREAGFGVLQDMIMDEILRQRQAATGVAVEPDELEAIVSMVTQQLGGPQGLQQFLMQNQMTQQQLLFLLEQDILISKLAKADVVVSDEEVEAWFYENQHWFGIPEQADVSHILVETEEDAMELMAMLEDGEDFHALAREHSLEPGAEDHGGSLGQISPGMTVPEFDALAFGLAPGEFGVTETQYGWHVVMVHSRTESVDAVYEDVKGEAREVLMQERAVDPERFLDHLWETADIEILLERYQ